jgi:hypothetical protein
VSLEGGSGCSWIVNREKIIVKTSQHIHFPLSSSPVRSFPIRSSHVFPLLSQTSSVLTPTTQRGALNEEFSTDVTDITSHLSDRQKNRNVVHRNESDLHLSEGLEAHHRR